MGRLCFWCQRIGQRRTLRSPWVGQQKSKVWGLRSNPGERAISFTLTLLYPRPDEMWMSWESWAHFHTLFTRLSSGTHFWGWRVWNRMSQKYTWFWKLNCVSWIFPPSVFSRTNSLLLYLSPEFISCSSTCCNTWCESPQNCTKLEKSSCWVRVE